MSGDGGKESRRQAWLTYVDVFARHHDITRKQAISVLFDGSVAQYGFLLRWAESNDFLSTTADELGLDPFKIPEQDANLRLE